jgi:hypothetical protein
MRIESSSIAMQSRHAFVQRDIEQESFRVWTTGPGGQAGPTAVPTQAAVGGSGGPSAALGGEACETAQAGGDCLADFRADLLRRMLEKLTGKDFGDLPAPGDCEGECSDAPPAEATASDPPRAGWGMEYHYRREHYEAEYTEFQARGTVRTADGRDIAIDVKLCMSREYCEQLAIDVRAGDAALVDPLVVNFSGSAAELSQRTFEFDLNADGQDESLRRLAAGNAFLALDRNANGRIDDGGELFGPATGDGLAELRKFDADGNGWIDEADAVYSRLRLFTPGDDKTLQTLQQAKLGAIYLNGIETPFAVKDSDNTLLAQVRQSTVALAESGSPMLVQQIDLAV